MGYNNTHSEYFMNETRLESEREPLRSLKREKHCCETVAKANKMLEMIKNFMDKSKEIIIPLYKCIVRPHLE